MHICPYCGISFEERDELGKHVKAFHPQESEEEERKKIKENPLAWIREKGFGRELELVRQGRCPVCALPVRSEELVGFSEWTEWRISGLCGPCQRKRRISGL